MARLEHFSVSIFFHSFALEEINVICFNLISKLLHGEHTNHLRPKTENSRNSVLLRTIHCQGYLIYCN